MELIIRCLIAGNTDRDAMDIGGPFDFTTEFENQTVAKSYIEQANERLQQPVLSAGSARGNKIIQQTGNDPYPQCSCESPILQASPINHRGTHHVQQQSASYLPVSHGLCCACRMVQRLPVCDCDKPGLRDNLLSGSGDQEDNNISDTRPAPQIRGGIDNGPALVKKKQDDARRKRNEARYRVLEPTQHKFNMKPVQREHASFIPWYTKTCVTPMRTFPRRNISRVSRR